VLQPITKKMEDKEEIDDNENAVDDELDEKGKQRPASIGFQGSMRGRGFGQKLWQG